MPKRFLQALRSVLGRDETAAAQDRLQEAIIKLKRELPLVGEDIPQLFQQNHYTEWTSAFASLMTEDLQNVTKWEDFAQEYQNQPVRFVLATCDLAWDSPRAVNPNIFPVARLPQ